MSNIKSITKLPLIINTEEIVFQDGMVASFEERIQKIVKERSTKIFVYKITYKSQGHKVVGYLVEPREGENLPCIICNRGGSRDFGKIEESHLFMPLIGRLAENGYICITSQYSGNAGGEGIDEFGGNEVVDVLNLYKILKKYQRANSKKIGMYGASRGGMMAYIILSQVKWLKAVAIHAGVADLVNTKKFRPEMIAHYKKMFGGSLKDKIKRSALYWVDKFPKKTPILIMHGTADWRVNPLDSLKLAEKLLEYKIPYRLIMYEGGDHGLNEFRQESNNNVISWFDRFVKNNEKLPNLKPHGQ